MIGPGRRSRTLFAGHIHHGRFDAAGARAAVEDHVDPAVEALQDVLGPGRGKLRTWVGAWGRERHPGGTDERLSDGVVRAAHRDGRPAGGHLVGNSGFFRDHKRQRARPEPFGQPPRGLRPVRERCLLLVQRRQRVQ